MATFNDLAIAIASYWKGFTMCRTIMTMHAGLSVAIATCKSSDLHVEMIATFDITRCYSYSINGSRVYSGLHYTGRLLIH